MADNNEQKKLAYTPAEFAALFGKSQSWGYRQLYAGKVEAITEYGRTMIPASEAEKILGKAGVYNGAGTAVAGSVESKVFPSLQKKKKVVAESGGSAWRKAVGGRRSTPGKKIARTRKRRMPGSR